MRKIIILVIVFLLSNCKVGLITKELKKGSIMFEKQDYNWEENNKEYKGKGKYDGVYYFKDGSEVDYSYNEINILAPKPLFYIEHKEFYDNGFIKEKGKYFGRFDVGSYSIKIGVWYDFDEKGNLIKQTNEDTKFGDFSYNEVLSFLDKKEDISLYNGKNRENLEIKYFYSEKLKEKLWAIFIKIGEPVQIMGDGYKIEQKGKQYYLDGNSGEIILRQYLPKYKSIIPSYDSIFPDLI